MREYLVWLVEDERLEWWALSEDDYVSLTAGYDDILKSRVFPGLWLEVAALLGGDLATVLETVRRGTQSPEHAQFAQA